VRLLELDPAFTISAFIARGGQSNAKLLIEGLGKRACPNELRAPRRRGDRTLTGFCAVHESETGTFRHAVMSEWVRFRDKPEVGLRGVGAALTLLGHRAVTSEMRDGTSENQLQFTWLF